MIFLWIFRNVFLFWKFFNLHTIRKKNFEIYKIAKNWSNCVEDAFMINSHIFFKIWSKQGNQVKTNWTIYYMMCIVKSRVQSTMRNFGKKKYKAKDASMKIQLGYGSGWPLTRVNRKIKAIMIIVLKFNSGVNPGSSPG